MKTVQQYLLVVFIGLLSLTSLTAQNQRPYLPHIQLRDRVLRQNVADFVRRSKTSWLAISVELDSTDQGYLYHLYPITNYETVRDYRGQVWGEWHHTRLVFYSSIDLRTVCQVSDTTSRISMQQYGRLSLPRANIRIPGTKVWRLNHAQADGGLEFTFKVVRGQEAYFFDNIGHDNRIEPDIVPAVPELN